MCRRLTDINFDSNVLQRPELKILLEGYHKMALQADIYHFFGNDGEVCILMFFSKFLKLTLFKNDFEFIAYSLAANR